MYLYGSYETVDLLFYRLEPHKGIQFFKAGFKGRFRRSCLLSEVFRFQDLKVFALYILVVFRKP